MYVSTIFYSIVSFTYPIIRLHVSTVCQSSSGLIQISHHMLLPYTTKHQTQPNDNRTTLKAEPNTFMHSSYGEVSFLIKWGCTLSWSWRRSLRSANVRRSAMGSTILSSVAKSRLTSPFTSSSSSSCSFSWTWWCCGVVVAARRASFTSSCFRLASSTSSCK